MKLKTILLMLVTLGSVFLSIYVSTLYKGFVAPYLIGFFTPIIVNIISTINIKEINNKKAKK